MATATEQIKELLNLMQEVDLHGLLALDRELHRLLKQKRKEQLHTGKPSAREEFYQRYRHIAIDPELFTLVGIHPENPVEEDKILIHEQISRRLAE